MAAIETRDGPVTFRSWSHQLQGSGGVPLDPGAIAALDVAWRDVKLKARGDDTLVKVEGVRIVLKDVARSDLDKDGDFIL